MKDNDIIEAYWQRNEAAIAMSSDKYGSYCRSIAYNILEDLSDTEECVNDTWLGAWNSMPPHRPDILRTFFGKLTRNLSFNRYRLRTAKKRGSGETALALSELGECVPSRNNIETETENAIITAAIEDFLRSEKPRSRSVFVRRYWYVQSVKTIAHDLSMSEAGVSSLLFRMRAKLKLHLEKEGITL